jgi:alpha-glucoside transport system permease protein
MAQAEKLQPSTERQTGIGAWLSTTIARVLISLFVPVITFVILWQVFIFLRDANIPQWITAIIAIIWGVGGVWLLFSVSNYVIEQLPIADRTHPVFEMVCKALIFMPMVISGVAASVIWKFIYEFRPPGSQQIGLLNGIVTAFGGTPQGWLLLQPWNNLMLVAIMIWLQTGFSMVILSSAIKGMPADLLEAGRIDGASEVQIFRHITVPYIQGTIITVATTVTLATLKVFDIVQSMTGGNFGTQVIANVQFQQLFRFVENGRAAAIAIILLVAVLPVMYYNLRQFGKQTEAF